MLRKMFATDGSEKDAIVVYKLYAQKRPEKMLEDDSSVNLAVNNNLKAEFPQTKEWFKVGPVGMNILNSFMKTMAQKTGINNERLRNHSSRKTMIFDRLISLSCQDIKIEKYQKLQQGLDKKADENVASS